MSLLPNELYFLKAFAFCGLTTIIIAILVSLGLHRRKESPRQRAKPAAIQRRRKPLPCYDSRGMATFRVQDFTFAVDLKLIFHTTVSLITPEINLDLTKLLHGDLSGHREPGRPASTTYEFIKGSDDPRDTTVPSAGPTERVTLIIRHSRDDWKLDFRFGLADMRLIQVLDKYVPQRIPVSAQVEKSVYGESKVDDLDMSLFQQGACCYHDHQSDWYRTPDTFDDSTLTTSLSEATVCTPVLREFGLTGTTPGIRLDATELLSLPWKQLTKVSLEHINVSCDDCICVLGRGEQVREFTLRQICNVASVLPSASRPRVPVELPHLSVLMLTAQVDLEDIFLMVKMPHLKDLALSLQSSPTPYDLGWAMLDSFIFFGQMPTKDIEQIRSQLGNNAWCPAA